MIPKAKISTKNENTRPFSFILKSNWRIIRSLLSDLVVFTKDFPENSKNYAVNDLQHEQMLVKRNANR